MSTKLKQAGTAVGPGKRRRSSRVPPVVDFLARPIHALSEETMQQDSPSHVAHLESLARLIQLPGPCARD